MWTYCIRVNWDFPQNVYSCLQYCDYGRLCSGETVEGNTHPASLLCYSKAVISHFVLHNPWSVAASTFHRLTDVLDSLLVLPAHEIRLPDGKMGNVGYVLCHPVRSKPSLNPKGGAELALCHILYMHIYCVYIHSIHADTLLRERYSRKGAKFDSVPFQPMSLFLLFADLV